MPESAGVFFIGAERRRSAWGVQAVGALTRPQSIWDLGTRLVSAANGHPETSRKDAVSRLLARTGVKPTG
jgi:hypothetical protein